MTGATGDVQDLAALDYAETALSEAWAALREVRDWDAAAAQRHGGIGVREFAAQFLEAQGFAPAPDTWDEADYRRDGDQALTALADRTTAAADAKASKSA